MIRLLIFLIVALAAVLVYTLIQLQRMRADMTKPQATDDDDAEEQRKAVIRHDLKGILNRIFALSRLIPMSGPLNEAQQEYLSKIEDQCKEGQEAVNRAIPKGPVPPTA